MLAIEKTSNMKICEMCNLVKCVTNNDKKKRKL